MEQYLSTTPISFAFCDYANEYHVKRFVELINHYMADPMGNAKPLTTLQQLRLLDGMQTHPASFVLFAIANEEIIGLTTCFINFSTFKVKPYLYIHDVIIEEKYRGAGIGKQLVQQCINIATERKYCKVTLEVREDNGAAKYLYTGLGFKECEPVMHFWTREIL